MYFMSGYNQQGISDLRKKDHGLDCPPPPPAAYCFGCKAHNFTIFTENALMKTPYATCPTPNNRQSLADEHLAAREGDISLSEGWNRAKRRVNAVLTLLLQDAK